jgi:hypothetical protein
MDRNCEECGSDISRQHGGARFCLVCAHDRSAAYKYNPQQGAHIIVQAAVRHGILPKLDGSIDCTDCDKPAAQYDHRDYMKPMEVDPVCCSCNQLRGMGINHFGMGLSRKTYTGKPVVLR